MFSFPSKANSFFFSQPALLKAVICKKGVLCSSPRIKFLQVPLESVLTWEGNNRIGGCSLGQRALPPRTDPLRWATGPGGCTSYLLCCALLSGITASVCRLQGDGFVLFTIAGHCLAGRVLYHTKECRSPVCSIGSSCCAWSLGRVSEFFKLCVVSFAPSYSSQCGVALL